MPHLFDLFREHSCLRKICVGAVRSDDIRVESVEEIITHIKKAIDIFGENVVQIAPDCGQRLLQREAAFHKLQNLTIAGEIINAR